MWRDAQIGVEKLSKIAPAHPALARMRQQLEQAGVAVPPAAPPTPPRLKNLALVVEEEEETAPPPVEPPMTFAAAAEVALPTPPPAPPTVPRTQNVQQFEIPAPSIEPPAWEPPAHVPAPEVARPQFSAPHWEPPVAPPPAPAEPPAVAATSVSHAPVALPVPAPPEPEVFGDFAADLDASLGAEFDLGAPAPPSAPKPMSAAPQYAPPAPVSQTVMPSVAAPAQVAPQLAPTPAAPPEDNSLFSDLIAEFKDDLGETPGQVEDPEQHYSLGIAFREMGLLDEAIGELQKVCSIYETGVAFPHILQTYTWLATCLVEKELPEASIRWYERALAIAPDEQSRSAIHYDMAGALEMAGQKQEALQHLLQVLGTNIDYRDTADRVRDLRAELAR